MDHSPTRSLDLADLKDSIDLSRPTPPSDNSSHEEKQTMGAAGGDTSNPQSAPDLEKGSVRPGAPSGVNVQDWNGPNDPDDPRRWSLSKKVAHILPVALLCFAVTAGSSIITPANPEIQVHFHVSREAAILSLSLFVLGLGVGPAIAAPLSETLGRSIVYKITTPCYILFILGAGFSKTFAGFLICRFLAGAAGGPVLAVGAGTNADLFDVHQRGTSSSIYIMAPFLGPGLAPVIGGFVAYYKGYEWTQWCTIFLALAALVSVLPMQETYKKVILKKRAKRLGIAPPPGSKPSPMQMIKVVLTITVFRPIHMLFFEPIVLLFSLYNSFTFSVLFAFFAAYPYTFETVYGFNTWQYGLTFLGIALGVVLAALTAVVIDLTVYQKKYSQRLREGHKVVPPEERLYVGMIGAFGITIGLFWFAWTARSDIHWISPVLAGIPFAWGNLAIFISAVMYLIDIYGPLNGASAMAANGLMRYAMGAAFPLFTFQMYEKLGVAWATSLLGFLSVAMLPIPWVFYKYGPQIRAKSHYDTLIVD